MSHSLLKKYRPQIDAIQPPDAYDCRNLLTGRVMHFIVEGGVALSPAEILQLTEEAMKEQQSMDHRSDRERRVVPRYFRI